jgi:hypothetical protein
MRVLLIAIAAASLFACKRAAPAEPPVSKTFDERQACTADADCAVVDVGCCDHCNGGTAVGVHRDFAVDLRRAPTDCRTTGCTKMACSAAEPICRQGRCGVSIDGHETLPDLPAPGD